MDLERQGREDEDRTPLDKLAKKGHFKPGDSPGIDAYDDADDGVDGGALKRPGSTALESGGTYMEDKGPNDLVHRAKSPDESLADDANLATVDKETPDEQKGDTADQWLRKNDPNYGKRSKGA